MKRGLLHGIWVFNMLMASAIVAMLLSCTPAKETPAENDSTSIEAVDTVEVVADSVTVDSVEVK